MLLFINNSSFKIQKTITIIDPIKQLTAAIIMPIVWLSNVFIAFFIKIIVKALKIMSKIPVAIETTLI